VKRTTIISSMLALTMASAAPLYAEGRTIAGADIGVMIPYDDLGDAVYVGGIFSPFVGYMFNPYIGVMGQAQVWFGKTEETGPTHDDNTTWAAAGLVGPRFAVPFNRGEVYATAQGGIATSLADEAITDTSPAFSAGAGLNFALNENWMLGVFGRWNHLYQRVHGTGDAKYITTGLALTYNFVAEAPPPPPPPPAPH
jgi:opacity protein-like surface antigen